MENVFFEPILNLSKHFFSLNDLVSHFLSTKLEDRMIWGFQLKIKIFIMIHTFFYYFCPLCEIFKIELQKFFFLCILNMKKLFLRSHVKKFRSSLCHKKCVCVCVSICVNIISCENIHHRILDLPCKFFSLTAARVNLYS